MTLPTIPRRIPRRPEEEILQERQCYCCDNRGIVAHRWILRLTPDYQEGDLPQACRRHECKGVEIPGGFAPLSTTVTDSIGCDVSPDICEELHETGRRQGQEDRADYARRLREDPQLPKKNFARMLVLARNVGTLCEPESDEEEF